MIIINFWNTMHLMYFSLSNAVLRRCFSQEWASSFALEIRHTRNERTIGPVLGQADSTERALILADVVLQSQHEALGMFGSEDDARLHLTFGYARQYADEIYHKLAAAMRDDGQVGISAFSHFGFLLNLKLIFGILVFHIPYYI